MSSKESVTISLIGHTNARNGGSYIYLCSNGHDAGFQYGNSPKEAQCRYLRALREREGEER